MDRFDDDEAKNIANDRWNKMHQSYEREKIKYDDWLELFDKAIVHCDTPIIDLGCGSGNDTKYLLEKGKKVIPCDYSEKAVENVRKNFPEVQRAECFDMTKGLPFPENFTDIIISDLSLHYFTEETTHRVLEDIHRVLKPNGLLIFRVNSVNDVNHGAGEGMEIEPNFYQTEDGRTKRFFNDEDIQRFFEGWDIFYKQEETMTRYGMPKELWRCVAKNNK
ncbi:MAG: class I SAM-dependent methyltransferase [Clostridia bacterium]